MKANIKLTKLNNDSMSYIQGGIGNLPGTCACLCDADIPGESARGCKKAQNTGCSVISVGSWQSVQYIAIAR
jgi:hypothetical protein